MLNFRRALPVVIHYVKEHLNYKLAMLAISNKIERIMKYYKVDYVGKGIGDNMINSYNIHYSTL